MSKGGSRRRSRNDSSSSSSSNNPGAVSGSDLALLLGLPRSVVFPCFCPDSFSSPLSSTHTHLIPVPCAPCSSCCVPRWIDFPLPSVSISRPRTLLVQPPAWPLLKTLLAATVQPLLLALSRCLRSVFPPAPWSPLPLQLPRPAVPRRHL